MSTEVLETPPVATTTETQNPPVVEASTPTVETPSTQDGSTETNGHTEKRGRGRPPVPKHFITLERVSAVRLNAKATKRRLREIAGAVNRRKSLSMKIKNIPVLPDPEEVKEGKDTAYSYQMVVRVDSEIKDEVQRATNIQKVLSFFRKKMIGWKIKADDEIRPGEPKVFETEKGTTTVRANGAVSQILKAKKFPDFQMPTLSDEVRERYFSDVYERNPHINIVWDSLNAAYKTKFRRRSHVLLYGPPATAKTMMLTRFKDWITDVDGNINNRIALIDGPSASRAGFERHLLEQAEEGTLPQVVILEELEKLPLDNMLSLLSILQSGYLQRIRAFTGKQEINAPILVLSTCNDVQLLKGFRMGALYSRFGHKLYASRPSPELLRKIVHDEARNLDLTPAHADAVLAILTKHKEVFKDPNDAREIVSLLDGGDRLLDGSSLNDLLEIAKKEREAKDDKKKDVE